MDYYYKKHKDMSPLEIIGALVSLAFFIFIIYTAACCCKKSGCYNLKYGKYDYCWEHIYKDSSYTSDKAHAANDIKAEQRYQAEKAAEKAEKSSASGSGSSGSYKSSSSSGSSTTDKYNASSYDDYEDFYDDYYDDFESMDDAETYWRKYND